MTQYLVPVKAIGLDKTITYGKSSATHILSQFQIKNKAFREISGNKKSAYKMLYAHFY